MLKQTHNFEQSQLTILNLLFSTETGEVTKSNFIIRLKKCIIW